MYIEHSITIKKKDGKTVDILIYYNNPTEPTLYKKEYDNNKPVEIEYKQPNDLTTTKITGKIIKYDILKELNTVFIIIQEL